jgi:hypothetical protein
LETGLPVLPPANVYQAIAQTDIAATLLAAALAKLVISREQ